MGDHGNIDDVEKFWFPSVLIASFIYRNLSRGTLTNGANPLTSVFSGHRLARNATPPILLGSGKTDDLFDVIAHLPPHPLRKLFRLRADSIRINRSGR